MVSVLVTKLLFHHQGLADCTDTYSIYHYHRVGAGPSMLGGGGNGLTINARVLPTFNLVSKIFEEL
jgi:hypothetical protein